MEEILLQEIYNYLQCSEGKLNKIEVEIEEVKSKRKILLIKIKKAPSHYG
ncbi:hypothetical protein [Oceanobacillus zhaokaii]|nr:hypothetical protein [Oceanobacillus zhaokaii]